MSELLDLYQRVILKHAKGPCGLNRRIQATHSGSADNPFCGDAVSLQLKIEDEIIDEAGYSGEFCAVCGASASLLCEHVAGMPVAAFVAFSEGLLAALEGRPLGEQLPEDLRALLAVRQFPVRIKCAALPWHAARTAMHLRQPKQPPD